MNDTFCNTAENQQERQNALDAQANTYSFGYGIVKHLILAVISMLAALIALARVKHGWSLEPLMWLAAVWYVPLLIIVNFAILRGQGRLGTLIAITTATAMVIMFPFTEIEKANWRVRMNGMQGRAEYVRPKTFWNWWEIAPGKLIPNGLAWRVPIQGIPGRAHVFKILEEPALTASDRKTMLADPSILSIVVESDSKQPEHQRIPNLISGERAHPQTLIIRSKSHSKEPAIRPSGDWILEQVDCSGLLWLHIDGVNFSETSWQQLLANSALHRITLWNTNGSPTLFGENRTYHQLFGASFTHVDEINVHDVTNMLTRSNQFREIQVSEDLASEPLWSLLLKESPLIYNVITINRSDKGRAIIGDSLDFSKKTLKLKGFRDTELDWICKRPLQFQPISLELYECDLSADFILGVISLPYRFEDCRMTRFEHDKLRVWLKTPNELWDEIRRASFSGTFDDLIKWRKIQIVEDAASP